MAKLFVDIGPLRRFPAFRSLWIGYAVRQLGAQLTVTTVIYQVFAITHSNLDVGLISLAQLGPAIVAPIIGGAIADAIDRRKLLSITAVLIAVCTVGLALNSIGGHPMLWPMFLCSAATWGLAGIDAPTRTAVMMTLVDRESILSTIVLRQLLAQVSLVAGPAFAGLLIAIFSRSLSIVYWIDVASTVAALQAVLRLPALRPTDGGRKFSIGSIVEGFRFVKSREVIGACFIADLNAMVLGMPVSLFPYMAFVHFHGGPKSFGLLTAAPAVGALLGAIISGWTNTVKFTGRAVLLAIALWSVAIIGFGIAPWLWLGVITLVIAGWADAVSALFRSTILQLEVPDRLRGRVSSLQSAVVQSGPRLGNTEAGVVAALANAQISIVTGGLGCLIGILIIARLMPRFSTYNMESATGLDEIATASS